MNLPRFVHSVRNALFPSAAASGRGRNAGIFAALLLVTGVAAAAELLRPKIVLPEPKYDLGVVSAGHPAEHVFEIRNGGDAVLEIRKVESG